MTITPDLVSPNALNFGIEREVRDMDYLPRWSIVRTTRQSSVAAHSYMVTMYALRLAAMYEWKGDLGRLAAAGLTHDLDELITADIPRPSKQSMLRDPDTKAAHVEWLAGEMKKRFPWYVEETDQEIRVMIGFADTLEALMYLIEERRMGNTNIEHVERYMLEEVNRAGARADATFGKDIASRIISDTSAKEAYGHSRIVGT